MSTAERAEATAGRQSEIREMETRVREMRARETVEERIDRRPEWAFVLLTAVYAVVVACLSHVKLLWLDELITLHIARLGSAGAIWNALARGADPNPPVTHLLVHWSRLVFGDHEWAYRLPAMAGYWVGMLALFLYLRRRLTGTWALAGTVLSMCMAAFDYSYESRSYGIFYGLAMLAFLCWSWTVDPEIGRGLRWLALVGMTAALALGISTNYFAVLAFVPIAVGEIVREIQGSGFRGQGSEKQGTGNREQGTEIQGSGVRGQGSERQGQRDKGQRDGGFLGAVEWRVWIALAVAGAPLLIYRPLIAHAIAQFAPYAWNKVSLGQAFDSYTEMVEIVLWPLLALFVVAIAMVVVKRRVARLCGECRARVAPGWFGAEDARGECGAGQGLKPGILLGEQSARLKSCPVTRHGSQAIPQGLKPGFEASVNGTDESVPFQNERGGGSAGDEMPLRRPYGTPEDPPSAPFPTLKPGADEHCASGGVDVGSTAIGERSGKKILGLPLHEAAGVFCFMAYPILGYAIASIRGGMLSPRFVIPVCFGFAIAGALAGHQMFGGFRRAGVLFLVFVSAWFLCRESCVAYWYQEQKECFYKVVDKLPEAEAMVAAGAPIAIPDPLLALTFHHYAPAAQARREVFPVDFPAVRAFRGDDSPEENLWAGRGWLYAVPIETVGSFQGSGFRGQEDRVQGSGVRVQEEQGTRDQGNEGPRRQGIGNREQGTEKQGSGFRGQGSEKQGLGIRDQGLEKQGTGEREELEGLEAGWETKGWDARAPGTFLIIAGDKNWLLRDLAMHHYAVRRLPLETRAAAIGGFTPLAHGVPEFFAAQWTAEPARAAAPFRADENVPAATKLPDARELDGGAR